MTRRKPGPGWHHVAGSVWDHDSGIRLHLTGLARMPNGKYVSANTIAEARRARLACCIAGGNRKRGLMMWALEMERTA